MADENGRLVGLHKGHEVSLVLAVDARDAAAVGSSCRSDDALTLVLLSGCKDSGECNDKEEDCELVHVDDV